MFGDGQAETADTVPASWEQLKRQEKGQKTTADALDAVARSLPGLWRAEKIQKKAAEAGFDWRDVSGALDKLDEETAELRQAVRDGTNVEEELGDVLFAAVKVGRFCGVDPEQLSTAPVKIHSPLPRDGGGRGRSGPQPVRHDAGGDDRPVERGQRMFLMRYNIVLG